MRVRVRARARRESGAMGGGGNPPPGNERVGARHADLPDEAERAHPLASVSLHSSFLSLIPFLSHTLSFFSLSLSLSHKLTHTHSPALSLYLSLVATSLHPSIVSLSMHLTTVCTRVAFGLQTPHERSSVGVSQPRSWSRCPVFVGKYCQKLTNLPEVDF